MYVTSIAIVTDSDADSVLHPGLFTGISIRSKICQRKIIAQPAGENPLVHRDVRRVRMHLAVDEEQRCLPVAVFAACWMDLSSIFA